MELISLLSGNGFVMFNKELAHEVSVNAAIIFGQLCSSYKSFGSKNMLSTYKGENYFYLTSETIQEETALSYKQQVKAIKDLEEAGYIKTVIMGSPARKYFHITNKIIEQFKEISSDKKEELNELTETESTELEPTHDDYRYSKRANPAFTKEQSKPLPFGQAYKEINKKEQDKNNNINFNCNFKEPLTTDKFRTLLTNACNAFYSTFALGRYSKKQWNTLINKFVDDTIQSERFKNVPAEKIKGFAYKCLESICDNTDYKRSDSFTEYQKLMLELSNGGSNNTNSSFYNWLNS